MRRDPRAVARAAGLAVLPLGLMVLAVMLWPGWNIPLGIYVDGAIQGLLLGLIALGFVIVYRANRIINFAAADLGAAPAGLAFLLWASVGWNIYLSIVIGVGSAIVLGVLVEFLFLRVFFKAPRLIMTVATIGVTDLLIALGLFLPAWLGQPDNDHYPPFFHATFTVSGAVFDGNDVLVLIVVPLVLLGLASFFRFSTTGIALKASAENADRASLLGVPVRRLQSVVWGLAALLAFIAMFLRIGVVGLGIGEALDPAVLLMALGAAVIARMERMPTAVLAAVGLSIVEKAAVYHYPSIAFGTAIPAAIVLVALVLQRTPTIDRLSSAATSTWQATREIKAIPAELRDIRAVRVARLVLAGLGVLVLVLIPFVLSTVHVKLVGTIGIFAIIALSLVVLTGWAGQVSLGQMAFVGVAGAVAGTLATRWHWDIGLILIAAGATGAVATVLVGLSTVRARGLAFAVATLAFSLLTSSYLLNLGYSPLRSWVPDGSTPVPRTHVLGIISVDSERAFYVLIVVVFALCLWMVRGLRSSRIGRVLIGVRDNERAAQAYAVGTRSTLVMAYAVSGFLAGIAGALLVLQQHALDADNFDPVAGLRVFAMVVVGGLGSVGGAVVGAIFVKGIEYFLVQPEWAFLSTGAGLLLVLMILPGGIGAALGDARDGVLRWYARRNKIRVPSLLADTRVVEPPPAADLVGALAQGATEVETFAEVRE
ncbi:MAG TPA: ABC transporter permease [Acidimicrobiia bacterium]|nr:ABC transporter permease [Acidimicrobiia bacterium]